MNSQASADSSTVSPKYRATGRYTNEATNENAQENANLSRLDWAR